MSNSNKELDQFNKAIKALALELPEQVWLDVNNRWKKLQQYIYSLSQYQQGEVNEGVEKAAEEKEEKYKAIEKSLGKKWANFVRDWDNNPIDYSNYKKLAEDCWLFLTSDKMPARSNIKKEAFLHEVSVMIEMAVLFSGQSSQPKEDKTENHE